MFSGIVYSDSTNMCGHAEIVIFLFLESIYCFFSFNMIHSQENLLKNTCCRN
jgi:hypothetical protein